MNFEKAVLWSDIHFGKKNNSDQHNTDCLNYINWMIQEAKSFGAETCICLGDFFDVRNSINVKTLNYALSALELLSQSFKKVIIIAGNHDLYLKDSRNIHSLKCARHIDNITIIDEITVDDDCAFVPWLVADEWERVKDIKAKYVFAHLELPNFFTNSKKTMHDRGGLKGDDFSGQEFVFSGHFHLRQTYKNPNGANIIYIGNCFPHDYSDANDTERGCVLLEHDKDPIFVNWEECPKYATGVLSDLLENPENYLSQKSHIRIESDLNVDYNETAFIREVLLAQFNARELIIYPKKTDFSILEESNVAEEFKSVDNIVLSHIDSLESVSFDKKILADIYNSI